MNYILVENIKSNCPPFALFDSCPSLCGPITCENLPFSCNKTGCAPKRCSCRSGFVQLSEDISEGCIPEDECFPAFTTTEESIPEGSGEELGDTIELGKSRESRSEECSLHSSLQDCVPFQPINCYTLVSFSQKYIIVDTLFFITPVGFEIILFRVFRRRSTVEESVASVSLAMLERTLETRLPASLFKTALRLP